MRCNKNKAYIEFVSKDKMIKTYKQILIIIFFKDHTNMGSMFTDVSDLMVWIYDGSKGIWITLVSIGSKLSDHPVHPQVGDNFDAKKITNQNCTHCVELTITATQLCFSNSKYEK